MYGVIYNLSLSIAIHSTTFLSINTASFTFSSIFSLFLALSCGPRNANYKKTILLNDCCRSVYGNG